MAGTPVFCTSWTKQPLGPDLSFRSKIDFDGDYKSGILTPVNSPVPGAGTTIPWGLPVKLSPLTVTASARNVGSLRLQPRSAKVGYSL